MVSTTNINHAKRILEEALNYTESLERFSMDKVMRLHLIYSNTIGKMITVIRNFHTGKSNDELHEACGVFGIATGEWPQPPKSTNHKYT